MLTTIRNLRGTAAAACTAVAFGLGAIAASAAAPSGWLAIDGSVRFNPLGTGAVDWANSGTGPPSYACTAGSVNLPGPGGLFNCGRPSGTTAPPIGPSLTPSAAVDPSIISADFIVDPLSTDTTACGSGDPTTIGGKNGDAISTYGVSTGSVPDKDELANVYAVTHTRADTGHPEIYFAAERLVNNGDSHMDFEFLQSSIGRTAACGGTLTGHRTEGDLLVAVDFTGGGVTAGTSVYQWHCVAEPGPQPADGTVCDPAGSTPPQHYEQIVAPTFLTFLINSADIPCGGWVCRDKLSGNSALISARDFLEGGIDLASIPFDGCFNSFLPHTRTAQSFTSVLKDFAGPVALHSCRDPAISSNSSPSTRSLASPVSATDTVSVANGGAGPTPTGTVTFFICAPPQTSGGCAGGTQVGTAKPLVAGSATSDAASATSSGVYCWRAVYTPDATSTGVYTAATHTNATTECFGLAAVPGLPNTGVPDAAAPTAGGFLLLVTAFPLLALRRTRGAGMMLVAALLAAAVPDVSTTPPVSAAAPVATNQLALPAVPRTAPDASIEVAAAMRAHHEWRLLIPAIGVNALIGRVGLDRNHAVQAPGTLTGVGWYAAGPLPDRPGDAVLDGHLGLPGEPAVFGRLAELRAGDAIVILWPDGHESTFTVASTAVVPASAPAPAGLFSRTGPSVLSLITCAGKWEQDTRTYTDRLVVNAIPA